MGIESGLSPNVEARIAQAFSSRHSLIKQLEAEHTNCYRLFHGICEGQPGLTVDRYGPHLLVQLFWGQLEAHVSQFLREYAASCGLRYLFVDRQARVKRPANQIAEPEFCLEQGQRFYISSVFRGADPYFYLDFRAVRRWLRQITQPGIRVLNLFAYTCTAGVAALAREASVVNVDFGRWCLDVGQRNAQLNRLGSHCFQLLNEDVFAVVRQTSGLGLKGRAAQRKFCTVAREQFDVVILDPPTMAASPFGKVDIINDYPALLKPSLLSVKPGGYLLAANHAAKVSRADYARIIERTAEKCGCQLAETTWLAPEGDFPSFDGEHPLKLAVIRLAG